MPQTKMNFQSLLGKALRSMPFLIHRASGLFGSPPQSDVYPSPEMLEGVRSILALKLDAIGDLLMATPALRGLRRRFPGARLDLLVQPAVAPVARLLPGLDGVDTLPCNFLLRGGSRLRGVMRWISSILRIRRRGYDLVVDFTGLFHSAAAAWAAGAPLRVGPRRWLPLGFFSTAGFGHFYTHEFATDEEAHLADRMNLLAGTLGAEADSDGWELTIGPEIREAAGSLLERAGVGPADGPLVVVHPGAKWPPKRWSEERMARTIDLLAERGMRVVVVGGPDDGAVLQRLKAAARSAPCVLWPPEGLETLCGLLERADAFLGSDSGPMHMAAAVGTPVVALFGPTHPGRSGPRGSAFIPLYAALECSPCPLYFTRDHCHRGHNYCMDGFQPHDVAAAVELSIERRRPPRRSQEPSP